MNVGDGVKETRFVSCRWLAQACLVVFLCAACGGGGGGGSGGAQSPQDDVTVSGRITFDRVPHDPVTNGLDYPATRRDPVRAAIVEAVDSGARVIATTATDDAGFYTVAVPANTQLTIRAKAQMLQAGRPGWNFRVVDNTRNGALYALESGSFNSGSQGATRNLRADSGWDGSRYSGTRAAGPFAILDTVYESLQLALSVDPAIRFSPLDLNWSPLNHSSDSFNPSAGEIITTAYFFNTSPPAIYILGDEDVDTDEYDPHVLAHEWGHYFEHTLGRTDSPGGSHSIFGILDPRLAFSEGWSNALSGMVTGESLYQDSAGSQQSQAFAFDLESNSTFNAGWYSESSVHSILYDLFDDVADGVDSVALGFGPIYRILTGELADTEAVTSLFSFIPSLKADQPALAANIDLIVEGQDIVSSDMDIWASTETNDAGNADVLPVYTSGQVDGPSVNVCSIARFGTFNGLSVSRFIRFQVPSAGRYRIDALGPAGSDPDLVLYDQGFLAVFDSEVNGRETANVQLDAGAHVLEIYEYVNLDTPAAGRTCFDVTVQTD